jgi:hypothetical protein
MAGGFALTGPVGLAGNGDNQRIGIVARATALQLDWETIANRFEFVIRGAIQSELEPRQNSQFNVPRPIPLR